QQVLMSFFYYLSPLYKSDDINTTKYSNSAIVREAILLSLSIVFTLAIFALVCVMAWLESDKRWDWGKSVFWGYFQFIGIGHSPVKPI
ncbi:hypothetical protein PMAYCL1PPCAC_01717, partial [Pristionchus mayeri]